ncbi:DUF1636 family protein [Novispirillum itersonii]|uniref:Putative metal-binding protein n=1 Tax=Novispirillum itersonii TaxID=189 RepID=A0A7W9ZF86_NOVIT|nr:DUF1636 domain-containing protein [Novispirillum itersonii]MBB6210028.1 putative metal-binding protein [Novispirillum itersonii]
MTTEIIVCETCRHPDGTREKDGRTGGDALTETLRDAVASEDGIVIRTMKCLMACDRNCTAHVRAPGKMAYTLGRLSAEDESAGALLEYVRAYQKSETGVVPFRDWPQGVKGKFVSRAPAIGYDG